MTLPNVPKSTGFGLPNSVGGPAFSVGQYQTDYYDRRIVATGTVDAGGVTFFTTPISGPNLGLTYDYNLAVTWVGGSVTAGNYILGWVTQTATFTATVTAAGMKAVAGGYSTLGGCITPDYNTAVTLSCGTITGTATILVSAIFSRTT